eukprot:scaffold135677_cov23-Tisochrysis_lutea.AAC.1
MELFLSWSAWTRLPKLPAGAQYMGADSGSPKRIPVCYAIQKVPHTQRLSLLPGVVPGLFSSSLSRPRQKGKLGDKLLSYDVQASIAVQLHVHPNCRPKKPHLGRSFTPRSPCLTPPWLSSTPAVHGHGRCPLGGLGTSGSHEARACY